MLEALAALAMLALLILISVVSYARPVWAGESVAQSITGIPIDILFSLIGVLLALVYADMRRSQARLERAINRLENEGSRRTGRLVYLSTLMQLVCKTLKIPYNRDDTEERDDL